MAEDKKEERRSKLYTTDARRGRDGGKSEPKAEPKADSAKEEGDKKPGADGLMDRVEREHTERETMHKRHEVERRDLHASHREDHRKMQTRHEAEFKQLGEQQMAAGPEAEPAGEQKAA